MSDVITETRRPGEFLVSEANGHLSREVVTVLSGQILKPGHVVGTVAHGAATAAAVAGNTGNGTIGAVTLAAGALYGVYRAVCIEPAANAGAFAVEDPNGVAVGVAHVGAAFIGGGLSFTVADGATDFAAGDSFTITVAVGSLKVKEWNPANTDGSEVAMGIMYAGADASGGDVKAVVIRRHAEVKAVALEYFTGAVDADKTAAATQLAAHSIAVR